MLKSFIFAASAALLVASPALAGPAGDTLKTALYAGDLAGGLSQLESMAASGDAEAAFGVGTIKLTRAIEHFSQTLYKHGFDLPNTDAAGVRTGFKVPQNPNPEPFDYDGVRQMLRTFVSELDDARASFDAASKSGDYVIEIEPRKVRIDANGDGRADEDESLAGAIAAATGNDIGKVLAPPPDAA